MVAKSSYPENPNFVAMVFHKIEDLKINRFDVSGRIRREHFRDDKVRSENRRIGVLNFMILYISTHVW